MFHRINFNINFEMAYNLSCERTDLLRETCNLNLATRNLIASQIPICPRYSRRLPRNAQLPPHSNPGSGFLVSLDLERTEWQSESRRSPLHEMR